MTWRCTTILPFLLALLACEPDKEEIIRLQRDVVLMEGQVQDLQDSLENRMEKAFLLLEQTLERVNEAQTAALRVDARLSQELRERQLSIQHPAATFGARIDQVTSDLLAARAELRDLSARFDRLEQLLKDLENDMRIMQTPSHTSPSASGGVEEPGAAPAPHAGSRRALHPAARWDGTRVDATQNPSCGS